MRKVLALTEPVKIIGKKGVQEVIARIDTGATKSSIDARLASEIKIGPIVETKIIKSAHGRAVRPFAHVSLEIAGETLHGSFSIADRSHMKFRVLIGQDLLKAGKFLVDPLKK